MPQPADTIARGGRWTKPELKKLGTIADVTGAQTAGPQGNSTKS